MTDERTTPWVFLHGFMQDVHTWDTVDLPPHTIVLPYTAHTDGSMLAMIERLYSSIQDHGGKAVLVGYSMGGRVAAMYALQHPETVSALFLESAGLGCLDEEERRRMATRNKTWAATLDHADRRSYESFIDRWEALPLFQTQRDMTEEEQCRQRRMRSQCDPKRLADQLRKAGAHVMPLEDETVRKLSGLACPIHYLYGKKDMKYAAVAKRLPPSFVLHEFDTGHNVHMEDPIQFSRSLREEMI